MTFTVANLWLWLAIVGGAIGLVVLAGIVATVVVVASRQRDDEQ